MPRLAFGRSATLILIALAIASAGCSSAHTSPKSARPDQSVITHEQIREHHFTNAYEAVQALHSNWLMVKGTDAFQSPVRVYVDTASLGGVESLRDVDIATIKTIRF